MSNFQYLFSPLKIGNIELPNRIMLAPHHLNQPRGSEAEIGYLTARIKGGVGLVFNASTFAVPPAWPYPVENLYTEEGIAAHARTAEAVHKLGAKIIVELLWAPGMMGSPSVSNHTTLLSEYSIFRSMTTAEVKQTIQTFADSAANAKKAGADGVEIFATCGAGVELFLSPLFNHRTDEYGGSLENRMRFILELLDEIRNRVGNDYIVGMDLNVDEEMQGGYTLEEGVEICKILSETKKIDYLRVDARNFKAQEGHFHYPSSYMPAGLMMYAAAAVREAVDIPVVGTHKINTLEYAEQLLAEGQCDAVAICRPLIADPDLINKIKRGEAEEVRQCIGCVEGCYQRFVTYQPVGCSVNPDVGAEYRGTTLAPADKKKKIVIAGGGVAGMEAARVAANRGHEVILLEKADKLGGHVNVQAQLPGLGDRGEIVRWLSLQVNKEKVDVRLNIEATAELISSLAPDAVIVATGSDYSDFGTSRDMMNPIVGYDQDYVLTPDEVMAGKEVGQNVVVYDCTDYVVGPGLAEMFADQGKDVTLITSSPSLAGTVASSFVNWAINMRVYPKVNHIRDTFIMSIEDHVLGLRNKFDYSESTFENADTVVLVTSKVGNDALYHDLVGKIPELYIIGDAYQTHYANMAIDAAIKNGSMIGKMI